MNISEEEYISLAEQTFDNLPDDIKNKLNNVAILTADYPSEEQLAKTKTRNRDDLFGLFEGYGQSKRINFGPVLPDRITLFRKPMMRQCNTEEEIKNQIASTLKHEIAHHFGSDEAGARKATSGKP